MTNSPSPNRDALALANRISNLEKRIEAVNMETSTRLSGFGMSLLEQSSRIEAVDRESEALKERLNALEPKAPSQETVRRDLDAWGDREELMAARAAGNAPPHYARMPAGYQPIDVAEKWITSAGDNVTPYQAALWFQIVKYAGRWPHNSPTADLRKLIDYAQRLLAALEGNR